MSQQEPNKFYDEAVQLWMHKQTLGIEEDPPNRENYLGDGEANKFFDQTATEAIMQGERFKNYADEYEAILPSRKSNKFYEIVVHFPENLEMKKEDLKALYDYLPLHRSEKYLIVDRLFIDLKNAVNPSLTIVDIRNRIEQIVSAANLVSLVNFVIVECDWIGELIELFDRDPYAHSLLKIASQDRNTCGHEWTFEELLAKVAIGEYQESQRMGKVAQDALTKAPPPIIIIKDEAEIERLRIQYSPNEKL
jgi:hypothetical protein